MNLTNLFNFNYLKENIKKSKAIILLCILLLPIINGIILLMNCSLDNSFMPNIYELSGAVLFGMYIVPIVLSITLFSFVYKKGSIDFTLSMPISKKQIFLTNTVGGIIILLLMQLINFIIMFFVSLIYSNIIIDYKMLFDILLIYSISYIFVFTCTNIAVSVSSNKITTIVVTLLILFLIPFISTFITTDGFDYNADGNAKIECISDECTPTIYECNDIRCEIDKKNNIYSGYVTKVDDITYTMPYELIKDTMFGIESENNINISLIKMSILSVIYVFVGLILFSKKKYEVVGTSFRSDNVHIFVRTLTTIPIVCISYIIIRNFDISSYDLFSIVLLLVLIFAYLIIYDLITRKKVTNFFKMAFCLVIVFVFAVLTGYFFDAEDYIIDSKDIDMLTFEDYDNTNIGSTKNKDIINYVISLLLDSSPQGDVYYTYHVKTNTKSGTYRFNIYATLENYNYITGKLLNDKDYLKTSSEYRNSRVFGIGFNDGYIGVNDNNLSKMITHKYKGEVNNFNIDEDNDLFNVTLYIYDDYKVRSININVSDDKDLSLNILKYYNSNTKKFFDNMSNDDDIYSYYINGNYYGYSYSEINSFIINNIDDDIDINKEYSYIILHSDKGKYVFVTNKVNDINEIINKSIIDDGDDAQEECE